MIALSRYKYLDDIVKTIFKNSLFYLTKAKLDADQIEMQNKMIVKEQALITVHIRETFVLSNAVVNLTHINAPVCILKDFNVLISTSVHIELLMSIVKYTKTTSIHLVK